MKRWCYLLFVLMLVIVPFTLISETKAQPYSDHQDVAGETSTASDHHGGHAGGGWEGSAQGMANSVSHHRFAGFLMLLLGLAELGQALNYSVPLWTRLVLPGALGVVSIFVIVWSDHDAWPIGSLSFVETFFGQDREIIEHKLFGLIAAAIALSETVRRIGWARHPVWTAPLILLTMIGGLLLFVHSHGNHPASARIELHHALMGSVGVSAAFSKGMASWTPGASSQLVKRWEVAWAGCEILLGILLLMYFE